MSFSNGESMTYTTEMDLTNYMSVQTVAQLDGFKVASAIAQRDEKIRERSRTIDRVVGRLSALTEKWSFEDPDEVCGLVEKKFAELKERINTLKAWEHCGKEMARYFRLSEEQSKSPERIPAAILAASNKAISDAREREALANAQIEEHNRFFERLAPFDPRVFARFVWDSPKTYTSISEALADFLTEAERQAATGAANPEKTGG